MPAKITVQIAKDQRRKALVVSHERSGTHFLMNTLAENFGYIARPWVNFDFNLTINFHSPEAIGSFFGFMRGKPVLNIVKSHHPFAFFDAVIEEILDEFHVFYIHRDPRDVMVSFWNLVRRFKWDEGPKTGSVGEFMRASPRGAILRYQKEQVPTLLDRWKAHVEGWACDAPAAVRERLIIVRYEDLNSDFEATVRAIGERMGITCADAVRPAVGHNVVVPGKGEVGGHRALFTPEDHAFVKAVAGETITRLRAV